MFKFILEIAKKLNLNYEYMEIKEYGKDNLESVAREKRYEFGNGEFILIPDAVMTIQKDGVAYDFFIEVDNTKELSTSKYYRAYKQYQYIPPPIISISNRRRRGVFDELELIKLKMDLSDFDTVFLPYL